MIAAITQRTARTSGAWLLLAMLAAVLVEGSLTAVQPLLALVVPAAVLIAAYAVTRPVVAACLFVFSTFFPSVAYITGAALSPLKLGAVVLFLSLLVRAWKERPSTETETAAIPAWMRTRSSFGAMRTPIICGSALTGLAVVSLTWVTSPSLAEQSLSRLVILLLTLFALVSAVRDRADVRQIAITTCVAAVCAILVGALLGGAGQLSDRSVGTFIDPNEFATALVAAIAMAYHLAETARRTFDRWLAVVALGVCAYGVLTTESRGGMIAFAVMLFVLLLTARGPQLIRLLGVLLLVGSIFAGYLGTAGGHQLTKRLSDTDSSGRTDLWHIARNEFRAHPLIGVGTGNFPVVSRNYLDKDVHVTDVAIELPRTTHDMYLEMFAELGLPGGLLFIGFVGGTVIAALRMLRFARRNGDSSEVSLVRALLAAMVGILACDVFLSGQYLQILWIVPAMLVILARDQAMRRAALEASAVR